MISKWMKWQTERNRNKWSVNCNKENNRMLEGDKGKSLWKDEWMFSVEQWSEY